LPIRYQRRHHYAFQFGTEASINLADDAGLLQLFQDANFAWVFIGIESPDEASLKETLKTQNTGRDMLTAVRALYTHGVDVLAGFIIGFDNDTLDSFDKQYRFITGACSATTASPNVSATKSVISEFRLPGEVLAAPAPGDRAPTVHARPARRRADTDAPHFAHADRRAAACLAAGARGLDRGAGHARLYRAPFHDRPPPGAASGSAHRRHAAQTVCGRGTSRCHLQILLRGYVGRAFFTRAARRLEKMLRRSAATVSLHIEALRADPQRQLERLLKRLAPYGDRVSVWIDERVRPLVPIDSSVFHLLLTRDARTGIPSA
jgi:hypothetical protein